MHVEQACSIESPFHLTNYCLLSCTRLEGKPSIWFATDIPLTTLGPQVVQNLVQEQRNAGNEAELASLGGLCPTTDLLQEWLCFVYFRCLVFSQGAFWSATLMERETHGMWE